VIADPTPNIEWELLNCHLWMYFTFFLTETCSWKSIGRVSSTSQYV